MTSQVSFPPYPRGMKGRQREIDVLVRLIVGQDVRRLALVGSGGAGKSVLARALGHKLQSQFPGGAHWFRSGPWDARIVAEMMAIRFGTTRVRSRMMAVLRQHLARRGRTLIILDNHENDAAAATLLNQLENSDTTWVLTARRCLLGGVYIHPVVPPTTAAGECPFPRVAALADVLRRSPVALDIADAMVGSGAVEADSLARWLRDRGIESVRVIDHEDDLPEVAMLVDWAWARIGSHARRLLAILAHMEGDHIDADSLGCLAGIRKCGAVFTALDRAVGWHLVQEPLARRYAVHATVRAAVFKRTPFDARRYFDHYVALLERAPERHELEQTHFYAAMDFAHRAGGIDDILRVERLADSLS